MTAPRDTPMRGASAPMTDGTGRRLKSGPGGTDGVDVTSTAPPRPSDAPEARARRSDRPRRSRRGRPSAFGLCAALLLACWAVAAPAASADTSFAFNGGGWGHGVGMSQWGARGMAAQGSSANAILTHYYSGASVGPMATSQIRVLLATASTFTVTPGTTTSFNQLFGATVGTTAAPVTVTNQGGTIALRGGVTGTATALVIPLGGAPLKLSPPGYRYLRGSVIITTNGSGLRAVLAGVSMQEYLYGLGEMPSSWPAAALQAQAIAARTYAQKKVNAAAGGGSYDIVGGLPDQSYLGFDKEGGASGAQWVGAVDTTAGQVVTYGGALIDAVYSASSGGYTEDSGTVWVNTLPYLKGVPDAPDLTGGNPNGTWTRSYTGSQLGTWFGVGQVTSVQVLGPLGVSGRVDKATIRLVGTTGTRDVIGSSFRSTVNARSPGSVLPSTKFRVGGAAPVAPVPANTLPFGVIDLVKVDHRTILVVGRAVDPQGAPLVNVVSTMGSQVATRQVRTVDGQWVVFWTGSPGTRNICVTILDTPTGQGVPIGCRTATVK
jgi:SpoIID/LytB domain protein